MKYYAGIDIGSTTSKVVILNDHQNIVDFSIVRNSYDLAKSGNSVFENSLRITGLSKSDIRYIISTGYGRRTIKFQDAAEPEVICHAKGTLHLIPTCRTIIDIGGQDSKIIELDERGVKKFQMNDKCSAGTGRYLDALAKNILGMELEQLGELSLKSKDPIKLSAQCTIFAESEIISFLSHSEPVENVIAGMHLSLARRVIQMGVTANIPFNKDIVFSGGVAKNRGMVETINNLLKQGIITPKEPQITGALGAALIAMERAKKKTKTI
jgi:predicted CoA-substrate-specific enzyme activase